MTNWQSPTETRFWFFLQFQPKFVNSYLEKELIYFQFNCIYYITRFNLPKGKLIKNQYN